MNKQGNCWPESPTPWWLSRRAMQSTAARWVPLNMTRMGGIWMPKPPNVETTPWTTHYNFSRCSYSGQPFLEKFATWLPRRIRQTSPSTACTNLPPQFKGKSVSSLSRWSWPSRRKATPTRTMRRKLRPSRTDGTKKDQNPRATMHQGPAEPETELDQERMVIIKGNSPDKLLNLIKLIASIINLCFHLVLMFICFEKYSSVINLDLFWEHLFSYRKRERKRERKKERKIMQSIGNDIIYKFCKLV